jgi:hypothetical protein
MPTHLPTIKHQKKYEYNPLKQKNSNFAAKHPKKKLRVKGKVSTHSK